MCCFFKNEQYFEDNVKNFVNVSCLTPTQSLTCRHSKRSPMHPLLSFTQSLTHSLTSPLVHTSIHSLTHSLSYQHTQSLSNSLMNAFSHSLISIPTNPPTHSFIHPHTQPTRPPVRSPTGPTSLSPTRIAWLDSTDTYPYFFFFQKVVVVGVPVS